MQAIHNEWYDDEKSAALFQRAKIQVKCKQFTTHIRKYIRITLLFQRAKIQVKCKQFKTAIVELLVDFLLFVLEILVK